MNVEYSSLVLGMIFSTAVFAFKTGTGLYCLISGQNKLFIKIALLYLSALIYFAIFAISFLVLRYVEISEYVNWLEIVFQSGFAIHLVIAAAMLTWGLYLLKPKHDALSTTTSKAWILLVLPCPICSSAIFLSLACLFNLFPVFRLQATVISYAVFFAIALGCVVFLNFWERKGKVNSELIVGRIMILITIYFLLIITIAPNFRDVESVYRLAVYGVEDESLPRNYVYGYGIMLIVCIAGFIVQKIKKTTVKKLSIHGTQIKKVVN